MTPLTAGDIVLTNRQTDTQTGNAENNSTLAERVVKCNSNIPIIRWQNLSVFAVDLVADDDDRKVCGLARTHLDEENIIPAVQLPERCGCRDVIDENAAVGAAEVADTQALEALLPRRVPYLPLNHTTNSSHSHIAVRLLLCYVILRLTS